MAAAVGSNNIYPPIVTPFSPNFVIGSETGCRVYFSISAYNSLSDYKDIQITVTRQSDNITAFNRQLYPSMIKIQPVSSIKKDETRESNDKYYITIDNSDIEGGFQTGIVYKVQMRFSSDASGLYATPQQLDAYLSSHLSAFSEWSQVCLVQGINQPVLQIKNGQGGILDTVEQNFFYIDTLEIVGTLVTDDTDPLRQYKLSLYDENNKLIEQTDLLFPSYQSSTDQINYVFKTALQDGQSYTFEVYYMTAGLYEETIRYPIFTLISTLDPVHATLTALEDVENGRIGINIKSNSPAPFSGIITIRRTDSKSNFELWEDVFTVELRAEQLDYTWYDYTIESGIWYKYCIQKRNGAGNRGVVTKLDNPVMMVFDDMFLSADGIQLKVKFNPQISTYQRIVNDSKTDSIGAQYPYIKRNGATYYRQFPISGLISFVMDRDEIFMSRDDYYGEDVVELYNKYNTKNRINIFNDFTYERHFREKVEEFLYKHNVKLFRSPTEGNILVKLTDISFQPNQTLGRRLYTFQCTAHEVADCTILNLNQYDIQSTIEKGNIDETHTTDAIFNGQWDSTIPAGAEVIHANPADGSFSVLEDYYNKDKKDNYVLSVESLDYLRLQIEDEPYLISDTGTGNPQIYSRIQKAKMLQKAAASSPSIYLGYIAYINGKAIVIPKDGIYELKGLNVEITSLSFPVDTNLELQYHVNIHQEETQEEKVSLTNFTTRIGQQWGGFLPGQSLQNDLWNKYYTKHPADYYQALVSINGIRIEANQGTVAYVREKEEADVQRHIIGPTESLDFYDPDTIIDDVYFLGQHFEQATDYEMKRNILPEGKCNITDIVVDNLDKIEEPQERNVYYLQSTNNENMLNVSIAEIEAVTAAAAPQLASLITAKGLPIFFVNKDNKNIAIIDSIDLNELKTYLENSNYEIYTTESVIFTDEHQIKVAVSLDGSDAFDFILNNEQNRLKLKAYEVLLKQYGDDEDSVAASIKRQLWKDVMYNVSDYYIYIQGHWYVYDIETGDAVCPVPASIDYVCETMKAYYRTSDSV